MGREVYLWIPAYLKDDFLKRFEEFFAAIDRFEFLSREEELSGRVWDFIALDRFKTSNREFAFWSGIAPLIGIDEGGPQRSRFDFLLDLLPAPSRVKANINAPGLLPLPKNRRSITNAASDPPRVLISFGAEDSAGLGLQAASALSHAARSGEITLIAPIPPHNSRGEQLELPGVRVMAKIPNLREKLAEYDLFITHFGLGAFEAVYAQLPLLLVSPTAYHEKLSKNAGFFSLGCGTKGIRRLGKLNIGSREFLEALEKRRSEIARRFGLEENQKENLGSFVAELKPRSPRRCPLCEEKTAGAFPVLARFPRETYRRCPACGTIYLARLDPPQIEYGKEYFFDFYKKQYGRTYLEDFNSLKETSRKRLGHIKALLRLAENNSDMKPSLLDIGCAYGPFLAAAAESGFAPAGIEVVEDAVRYVKEKLGFPARQGFFPGALNEEFRATQNGGEAQFDAITLWYVIEHFEEPGKMLCEINRLLKDGGVLAFSTPSFSGISGRRSLKTLLKNSPPDHFTVWSPRLCKKILSRYGFRLHKIVVTGHHPERFPLLGRYVNPARNGIFYRFLLFISRLFRLGDTFEAYGVKTGITKADNKMAG
jgi:2-polyprenyl-3-methyl-5-hydroxy-6-metoxy-1,4-benzoquinol methylase